MPDVAGGQEETPPSCPRCAARVRVGAHFCRSCGAELWPESVAPLEAAIVQEPVRQRASLAPGAEWPQLKQLLWLFTILLGSSLVAGLASHIWRTPVLDTVLTVFDAIVVIVFVVSRFPEVAPFLRVRKPKLRETAEVLAVAAVFAITVQAYFAGVIHLGIRMVRI